MTVIPASFAIVVASLGIQAARMRRNSYRRRQACDRAERDKEFHVWAPCPVCIAGNFRESLARVFPFTGWERLRRDYRLPFEA